MVKRRKQKFDPKLVPITVRNMLATWRQEALLHPYPKERKLAAEAAVVAEGLLTLLVQSALNKNETLNAIAQHRTDTSGGLNAICAIRQTITSANLHPDPLLRSLDEARNLVDMSVSALQGPGLDQDLKYMEWVSRALDHISDRLDEVNYVTLVELSILGSNYENFPK